MGGGIMMIKADKFFVAELQEKGYNLDYKTLTEIYKTSRNRPACKARKARNEREEAMLQKLWEKEFGQEK